jgi:hypothetical protein
MPVKECDDCMLAPSSRKAAFSGLLSRSCLPGLFLVFVAMASFLCAASVASGADLSQAVVRKKLNTVTVAPSLGAQAQPAAPGTIVYDKNVVQTGTASQAEIEFSDSTRARMTSNAIFTFDVNARSLNFQQGAGLISKPTNSGKIDFTSGAVSGAMTGSTVFISTVPTERGKAGHGRSKGKGTTTLIGMLEGKVHGGSRWTDQAGREQTTPFSLGPGEMLVARSDRAPLRAQFDIPRFLKSSPLVKMGPLPNADALARAVADYRADERSGFIEKTNVMVSNRPRNVALVGQVLPLDVVAQLKNQNPGGFLPVGSTGIIRAQLVWNTSADLDLYLTLPTGQVVSFSNVSVTFNNGRATALLDHDNVGNTIDVPPNIRVENIVVNGVPLGGLYSFVVNNFNTPNGADSFTLRVFYNGQLQLVNGTLAGGRSSPPVVVRVPGG